MRTDDEEDYYMTDAVHIKFQQKIAHHCLIWCRVVRSHEVSPRNIFDGMAMSGLAFSVVLVDLMGRTAGLPSSYSDSRSRNLHQKLEQVILYQKLARLSVDLVQVSCTQLSTDLFQDRNSPERDKNRAT